VVGSEGKGLSDSYVPNRWPSVRSSSQRSERQFNGNVNPIASTTRFYSAQKGGMALRTSGMSGGDDFFFFF